MVACQKESDCAPSVYGLAYTKNDCSRLCWSDFLLHGSISDQAVKSRSPFGCWAHRRFGLNRICESRQLMNHETLSQSERLFLHNDVILVAFSEHTPQDVDGRASFLGIFCVKTFPSKKIHDSGVLVHVVYDCLSHQNPNFEGRYLSEL